jgi:alpha-beta hydrolase superfamily lysophospholipase
MAQHRARPVTPDRRVRDLRKEFQAVERDEPGPQRAVRLAELTRAALDDRQVNMAMQAATHCLAEDTDAPVLLLAAFSDQTLDPEAQLVAFDALRDLARYIEQPELGQLVTARLETVARSWVAGADPGERRYRLRTVQALTSRATADALRADLEPPAGS